MVADVKTNPGTVGELGHDPGPVPPRTRSWPSYAATPLLAAVGAAVALEGQHAGPWVLMAALAALVPVAAIVERRRMPVGRRPLLAPLTFFVFAFVAILLVRAVPLAAGVDGRYFSLDDDLRVSSILASGPRLAPDGGPLFNTVRNPSFERGGSDWEPPTSDASGPERFSGTLSVQRGRGFSGSASGLLEIRTGSDAGYVALVGAAAGPGQYSLEPGDELFTSLVVRPESVLPRAARIEVAVRFRDAQGRFLADVSAAAAAPGAGAWQRIEGTVEAPARAASDDVVLLIRGLRDGRRYAFSVDDAMVTTAVRDGVSTVPYFDGDGSGWQGAYTKALAIAVGVLLVILAGFVLPLGARAPRRMRLTIARPGEGPRRRVMLGLLAVGIAGFALEMRSYGGYGAYLESLGALGVEGLGKWYLHAAALLPSAIGVAVLVRWIALGRPGRPSLLELAVSVIGLGIAFSYFLKTSVAIPLLTMLLAAYYFRGRRAAIWVWIAGAAFAVVTPFVYLVRGTGRIDPSKLFEHEYWSSFVANLTSRFFHFESLMISAPFAASEPVWQPLKDFVITPVPRVLWPDKPVSPAARFTEEFLRPGLHTPTDIGVLSLPGELWLAGGVAGVLIFGLVVGVLIRAATALVAESDAGTMGMLLAGCALTVGLLMLNDGWGMASVLIVNLIAQVGWVPFLRRARSP